MSDSSLENATHLGEQGIWTAVSSRWWLPVALGVLIALLWTVAFNWLPSTISVDINQHRANTAIPPIQETDQVLQTFIARHDGLTEVELLLVRHSNGEDGGKLRFRLLDSSKIPIAVQSIDARQIVHNQSYSIRFPVQTDSKGQSYTLAISGTPDNQTSLWAYDLDVYDDGSLQIIGARSDAQELRFVTRYQLLPPNAAITAIEMAWSNGILIILTLLLLLLPGSIILIFSRSRLGRLDPFAWLGAALGIGASVWPIVWFWLTFIGGRWRGWSLWAVLIIGWLFLAALLIYRQRQRIDVEESATAESGAPAKHENNTEGNPGLDHRKSSIFDRHIRSRLSNSHALKTGLILLIIITIGFVVRLLAVRDLAFPAWVDSSRHGLITALMVDSGQFIEDYRPLLPVDRTPYHYGFHTLAASVAMLTGESLPNLLLIMGQFINALVPLTVYAATYLFTRRRSAALLAAFLLALPFLFPGYYATWGRFTQLTGMLVLPIAVAFTWGLISGARRWQTLWWVVGVLAAGLFFIHFRVFLFFVVYVAVVLVVSRFRRWLRLLSAAILALLLVAPRIVQLATAFTTSQTFASTPGYNDFPTGYLRAGWETGFLGFGIASLIFVIIAVFRRRRWAIVPMVLSLWVAAVLLLVAGRRLGIRETWLVNINSAYISFFLPLSIVLAIVIVRIWNWLNKQHWSLGLGARLVAGTLLTITLLFGLARQVSILNPSTILADAADEVGLDWLSENAIDGSTVAVNSWRWLGNIWAASDGGAWTVPMTALNSTTPPVDYTYDPELRMKVNDFNAEAIQIEDWSSAATVDWLRENEVNLIFVGARGGSMDPSDLMKNPALQEIYSSDGVFIFAVE